YSSSITRPASSSTPSPYTTLFRSDYSADNVPYTPKYTLWVNMDGLKEGDFTMVFGFPGTTDQYLPSYAVKYVTEVQNPAQIAMRSEEHTSELQSRENLVCRLLLEK